MTTFHASPKLAMEAPPESFAYTLQLSPDFSSLRCKMDPAVQARASLHIQGSRRQFEPFQRSKSEIVQVNRSPPDVAFYAGFFA